MYITVGLFNCFGAVGHTDHRKSIFVEFSPIDVHADKNLLSNGAMAFLAADFDESAWDQVDFAVEMPRFPQLPIEPRVSRRPIRVIVKRAGELHVERFRVEGHRRRRHLVPV